MKAMALWTLFVCGLAMIPGAAAASSVFVRYETIEDTAVGRTISFGLPFLLINGLGQVVNGGPNPVRVITNIRADVVADPHSAAIFNNCVTNANDILKGTTSTVRLVVSGSGTVTPQPTETVILVDLSQGDVLECFLEARKRSK